MRNINGKTEIATLVQDDAFRVYDLLSKVKFLGTGNDDFTQYIPSRYYSFIILYKDGHKLDFSPSPPFYILNGTTGYRYPDSSICYSLCELYYELNTIYFPD